MISSLINFAKKYYHQRQQKRTLEALYSQYSKGVVLKKLTTSQKEEIIEYWKSLTGKTVTTKWHELLSSLTGVYKKDYMPFEICMELQDALSPRSAQRSFDDKNLYRYLLKDFNISKRYVECSSGYWTKIIDGLAVESSRNEIINLLQNLGQCVIKPSIGTDGGNGVRLLDMHNGIDTKTEDTVGKILDEYYPNFLVEDRIVETSNLANLNPDSCNTMRVHTWRNRKANQIEFVSAYMRIGRKGTIKDNMYSGGMGVKVYSDGILKHGVACYPYQLFEYTDAGTAINNYNIEDFEIIKETALKAHANLPMFDLCGWDMGVDKDGNVIIIEFNPNPDVRIEQCILGGSCYQEHTEEVCKQVFKR